MTKKLRNTIILIIISLVLGTMYILNNKKQFLLFLSSPTQPMNYSKIFCENAGGEWYEGQGTELKFCHTYPEVENNDFDAFN